MKNFLLGALSVMVLGLLSFNNLEESITIKPAIPKKVLTQTVQYDRVGATISKYVKEGYVLHSVYYGGGYSANTVVMYKY